MATLKDHQQAMVDLLASGSGIPASASRLAHAMHDLIEAHLAVGAVTFVTDPLTGRISKREDATTPGLNDKALAADVEFCMPKPAGTPAERRVKELENTIRQLKVNNATLKSQNEDLRDYIGAMASKLHTAEKQLGLVVPEQAGCRKDDTQVCDHEFQVINGICWKCGVAYVDVCHQDKYK
jgi:predicted RNase H-like nuclease (RuvC/YqgF family)